MATANWPAQVLSGLSVRRALPLERFALKRAVASPRLELMVTGMVGADDSLREDAGDRLKI